MKRTTYIVIGEVVAGLLAVIVVSAVFIGSFKRYDKNDAVIDGQAVRIGLSRFACMNVREVSTSYRYSLSNLSGIEIEEREDCETPYLVTVSDLQNFLDLTIDNDTLSLGVRLDSYCDSVAPGAPFVEIQSAYTWPVRVIVPPGSLREVRSNWNSVLISGFKSKSLRAKIFHRLDLKSCSIDSLMCDGGISTLALDDSEVENVEFLADSHCHSINCCDGSGTIGRLDVFGGKDNGYVDLTRANIRNVYYNPVDSGIETNIKLNSPVEISRFVKK